MPRAKPSPTPPAAPIDDQTEKLTRGVEALGEHIESLAGQVEVLRIAIDDLRQEVEHAIRNAFRPAWTPVPPITSLAKDPLAEDFHERVNRYSAADLPELPAQSSSRLAAPSTQGELWPDADDAG